jgi:phosphatidylserine/phosphatidylglycerophosphate/cardiolipin synthase-like enzyme
MVEAGAVVLIDAKEPIAHEKALVIDGELVEFGSYNFTAQAEKNREICVVMHDRELARKLAEDWHAHEMHAEAQQ